MKRRIVTLALSVSVLSASCGRLADGAPPIVFRDVNVVPMASARVLAGQSVLVRDRVVREVGDPGSFPIPRGAIEIDGRGRYLLPGLTDLHVHLEAEEELPLYLANGVTTVMNTGGRPWHLELRERIARGEVSGPRVFTCGPYTQGPATAAEAREIPKETADAGYDCVKNLPPWTADTYIALLDAAEAAGIPVYGHAPRSLPFDSILAHPWQRLAHLEEIIFTSRLESYLDSGAGDRTPPLPVDEIRRLARAVAERGIWVTPTQVVVDLYTVRAGAEFDELLARSYMRYVNPVDRRRWARARLPQDTRRYDLQSELQQRLLSELHDAGARIALGTDGETPSFNMVMPGWSVHQELRLMVEAGFSPYEALQTATVNAAAFLGRQDGSGTIGPGTPADLILVDGNPLEDIGNAADVAGVVAQGRWIPREELAETLATLAEGYEPLDAALTVIDDALATEGPRGAVHAYQTMPSPPAGAAAYVERTLNILGYTALQRRDMAEAIEIFELDVSTFPDSPNTYDSLGQALLFRGDTTRAVESYRQALEVDPTWQNAQNVLAQLGPASPAR